MKGIETPVNGENRPDDYPTCAATYATFRIYCGELSLDEVTARLSVAPTHTQSRAPNRPQGWFLSTKGMVESRDVSRHVDWLLGHILPLQSTLHDLQSRPDVRMDIFCYWRSAEGHGGPTLDASQMRALAELNIEIGFDCY